MGYYRRLYSDLSKRDADKEAKGMRERGHKYKRRIDPNGRYELWILSTEKR